MGAMSRPLRLQIPGGIYHVTARGNARRAIFEDDDDCARFLTVLAGTVARYRVLCHAYCLMGNHYHLLVQTLEANLSLAMRHLNGVYTQGFNRRHERCGHVLQGRFAARWWMGMPTYGKSAATLCSIRSGQASSRIPEIGNGAASSQPQVRRWRQGSSQWSGCEA